MPHRRSTRAAFVACLRSTLILACLTAPARAADPAPAAIDLQSPEGKEIADKLATIDAEAARLRQAGLPARADDLAARAAALRARAQGKTPPPAAVDDGPELHLISVMRGNVPAGAPRPGLGKPPQGTVTVDVRITDRPLVLALCSHSPIKWELKLAPGARVQRVILSGYYTQELAQVPPDAEVESTSREAGDREFFRFFRKDAEYAKVVRILAARTNLPVSTVQFTGLGKAGVQVGPFLLDPANPETQCQRILVDVEPIYREATAFARAQRRVAARDLRFQAIRYEPDPQLAKMGIAQPRPALADFTAEGPIAEKTRPAPVPGNYLAVDPRDGTWYGVNLKGVTRFNPGDKVSVDLPIGPDLPPLSWPCGLAFDTKRNRLVLTSLGGVGHMYAFDTATQQWSLLREMDNVDLHCLTYSAADDCFYGLAEDMPREEAVIHRFSAHGRPLGAVKPAERIPLSRHAMHDSPPQLIDAGGDLLVLLSPGRDQNGRPTDEPSRVLRIDPRTGQVSRPQSSPPPAKPVAASDLSARWDALRDAPATDAEALDKAVDALAAAGDPAAELLRAKTPAVKPADPGQVAALIEQLGDDNWKTREEATARLKAYGATIQPQLRKALDGSIADEARTRLQSLLRRPNPAADESPAELDARISDPDLRLRLRAIRVLARLRTPAAVDELHRIASAPPGVLGVAQAQAILRQL